MPHISLSPYDFFDSVVLNETVNISLKHRYIYFEVPKAGSSSILTVLNALELEEFGGNVEVDDPHPPFVGSPFVKPYQIGREAFVALLHDPHVFKFSFVRNPFPRVLSGYLDKVLSNDDEVADYYRSQCGIEVAGQISFELFLQHVAQQSPEDMNKHWRPMVFQSFMSFCRLDFVGKVENFAEDFAYIGRRIGVDLAPIGHVAPHATGALGKLSSYYNDELEEVMRRIYSADFSAFGYTGALPVTSSFR